MCLSLEYMLLQYILPWVKERPDSGLLHSYVVQLHYLHKYTRNPLLWNERMKCAESESVHKQSLDLMGKPQIEEKP